MRDYDAENHFMEVVHYVMSKCEYRRDFLDIGICSLNVTPCEKVLYDGECEAVRDWLHGRGEWKDD